MVHVLTGRKGEAVVEGLDQLRGSDLELAVLAEAAAALWALGGGRSAMHPGSCVSILGADSADSETGNALDSDASGGQGADPRSIMSALYAEQRDAVVVAFEPGASHVVVMERPRGGMEAAMGGAEFGGSINRFGRCYLPFDESWEVDGAWISGPFGSSQFRQTGSIASSQVCIVSSGCMQPFAKGPQNEDLGYSSYAPPVSMDTGGVDLGASMRLVPVEMVSPVSTIAPNVDAGVSISSGGSLFDFIEANISVCLDPKSAQLQI